MSKRKIENALRAKGLMAESVYYDRTAMAPSGYCPGWHVELTEDSEQALIDVGWDGDPISDAETSAEVLAWIAEMPTTKDTTK